MPEDTFKPLFELAPDAIFLIDTNGAVVDANLKACRDLGYTRAQLLRLKVPDLLTDFNGKDIPKIAVGLDEEEIVALDVNHKKKNGERYAAEIRVNVVKLEDKIHYLVVSRENTERLEAEKELIKSEGKYRLLAENITDVVFVLDLNLKVKYVTPSVEKFLGYTPDEILKMNIDEFMLPESVLLARKTVNEQLLHDENLDIPGALELCFRTKDGTALWSEVTSSFIRDERGEVMGIQGVSRNIDDRKKAEAIVVESEARYRDMFEQNPLPMYVYDVQTLSILDANRAAVQHYGYSLNEFVGLTLSDIQPGYDLDSGKARAEENETGKAENSQVIEHYRKDGSVILVETTTQSTSFLDRPAELVLVYDVTDSKLMEEAMRKNAQLAAVGQIASGIAHEINNPLATISASTEALMARLPELREGCRENHDAAQIIDVYEDYLSLMFDEVQRSGKIIRDLLDLARIKHYDLQHVDLVELVENTIKLFSVQSRLDDYKFVFVKHFEQILFQADRDKIRQVLIILLSNAVEAMPGGGRVNIVCDANRDNRTVTFSIMDQGRGMDEMDLSRIFEPFYTTKGAGGGTGLGLSIADTIVSKHGGLITARRNKKVGMTFEVILPAGPDDLSA